MASQLRLHNELAAYFEHLVQPGRLPNEAILQWRPYFWYCYSRNRAIVSYAREWLGKEYQTGSSKYLEESDQERDCNRETHMIIRHVVVKFLQEYGCLADLMEEHEDWKALHGYDVVFDTWFEVESEEGRLVERLWKVYLAAMPTESEIRQRMQGN